MFGQREEGSRFKLRLVLLPFSLRACAPRLTALRLAKKAFGTGRQANRNMTSENAYLCLTTQFAGTPECVQGKIFTGKGTGCGGEPGGTFRGLCQGKCTASGYCTKVPCPQLRAQYSPAAKTPPVTESARETSR